MRIRNLKSYKLKKGIYEQDDELNDILVGYEEVKLIQASIQPSRGQSKVMQYGTEITKYHTVFCYYDDAIEEGMYMEYQGEHHEVQPIMYWNGHITFDIKVVG